MCDYSPGRYFPGDCYPLLTHVLADPPAGCAVEFGVGHGDSLALIAAAMPVVGFDSFRGLPEDWRPGFGKGSMACRAPKVRNARIVTGLFSRTLPRFDFAALAPIGLVHVDCDLYSSTATVLQWVGPYLGSGAVLVFDDWFAHGYDPQIAAGNEQRAWREFTASTDIRWTVIGRSDQEWAIRLE